MVLGWSGVWNLCGVHLGVNRGTLRETWPILQFFSIGVYSVGEEWDKGAEVILGASWYWAEAHEPPEWRKDKTERY